MKIYIDESIKHDKEKSIQTMNNIRTIRFRDIVSRSRIYFEPDNMKTTVLEDKSLIDFYNEFSALNNNNNIQSPWVLRLEIDRAKMYHYNLDMITLYHILDEFYDDKITCIFSDDNAKDMVFRIKLDPEDNDNSNDILTDLKALEKNIMETLVIKGVNNIEKAGMSEIKNKKYDPLSDSFYMDNEWMIYTAGTNLREILGLNIIDSVRTITNDINEIYDVLGIEAARQALYNEITDILDSVYVDFRHIALLIDVMTNKGSILSVNRHGINRGDIGPLAKCSFEETTDKLVKAGVFSEYDKINGVAANIMLGQIPPCGTGDVELLIDEDMIIDNIDNRDFEEINDSDDDDECIVDNFMINFKLKTDNVFLEKKNNDLIINNEK